MDTHLQVVSKVATYDDEKLSAAKKVETSELHTVELMTAKSAEQPEKHQAGTMSTQELHH